MDIVFGTHEAIALRRNPSQLKAHISFVWPENKTAFDAAYETVFAKPRIQQIKIFCTDTDKTVAPIERAQTIEQIGAALQFADAYEKLNPHATIAVICPTGQRAAALAMIMAYRQATAGKALSEAGMKDAAQKALQAILTQDAQATPHLLMLRAADELLGTKGIHQTGALENAVRNHAGAMQAQVRHSHGRLPHEFAPDRPHPDQGWAIVGPNATPN